MKGNSDPLYHSYTFTMPTAPWHSNRQIWAIVPARGGSKGIPRKNLQPVGGKPLLAWTLEACQESSLLTGVFVSTDDEEIAGLAAEYGATAIMRPPEISGDFSPSEDALRHVLAEQEIRPDIVVMLQATSPLRAPGDIDAAIRMVKDDGYDSVLSAVRLHQFVWRSGTDGVYSLSYQPMAQRPMRQSVEEWVENGSIYVFRTGVLEQYGTRLGGRIGVYEMDYWSRFEIDGHEDLDLVGWIMRRWEES